MKKFLSFSSILFLVLIGFNSIHAQTTVFSEDFQSGMPGSFTLIDNDGKIADPLAWHPSSIWGIFENPSTVGDSVAASTSYFTPLSCCADDWMITPAINLSSNNTFSWNARSIDANFLDAYEVRISTTTPTMGGCLANPSLFTIAAENFAWTPRSVNLSTYNGMTVYLAIRNVSDDKNVLLIDDLLVQAPAVAPAGACSVDTVEYPFQKGGGNRGLLLNSASGRGVCQYFDAPQPITVSGMTFFGYKQNATGGISQTITCQLYLAGPDSMPTGLALATATISVDTALGNGFLSDIERSVSWTPVTVAVPYVVVLSNNSVNSFVQFFNDWDFNDGGGEWLSSLDFSGTWTRSYGVTVGGNPLDADAYLHPHCSYDVTSSFTPNVTSGAIGATLNWTNTSSPVIQNRMYSQWAFFGSPENSFTWDYGDASPTVNLINGSHSYASAGPYTVTLTDSMFGWNSTCTHDTTGTVTIVTAGPCAANDALGSASNLFTMVLNESNPLIVNNDLNTILFIHRNNTTPFGGHSGQYRYDISTNAGTSWTNNLGVLNPLSIDGTNAGRYPMVSIYNPTANTNPNNAYLVYQGATFNTNWNGYVTGVRKLNGTGNTENYNQAASTNTQIVRSQVQGVNGTYWAIDEVHNGTQATGYRVLKGVWGGSDVTWSTNTTLTPAFNTAFDGMNHSSDFAIGFDPSGMNGWVAILTHIVPGNSAFTYQPVFYHTTNGGTSWSGPEQVDLTDFNCITSNIGAGNQASTAFDLDLTVDIYGNPHCIVEVGNGDNNYAFFNTQWHAVFDITKQNGGWNALEIADRKSFRGNFGIGLNTLSMDLNGQASRSDDGSVVFFTWTDTDTAGQGSPANLIPNLFGVGYNVVNQTWTAVENFTGCNPSYAGQILFPTMSPIVLDGSGGTSYILPVAFADLAASGEILDPTDLIYLDGIEFANSDFVNAQCTTAGSITQSGPVGICSGNSTTLNATGGTSYEWSTSGTNSSITASSAGLYSVIIRNNCCVVAADTIQVIVNPVPVSSFSSSTTNLTATFTDNSTGTPTSWAWTFGDGNTSILQNPSHTYASSNTYNVCLTVTNACGNNQSCSNVTVSCAAPVSSFNSSASGLAVNFTDNSTNTPSSWSWDFGDGNSSISQNPSHTYATNGSYTACLISTNACGSDTTCSSVSVTCASPVSTWNQSSVALVASFTDISTNGPASWLWDFGDGNTSVSQNPSHTYLTPGTYGVCLTVVNPCGTDSSCQSVTVSSCAIPTAGFTSGATGLAVTFADTSTQTPISWSWTFGDGGTSILQNPSHTYTNTGSYTVCLTVVNSCSTATKCETVVVSCSAPVASFTNSSGALSVAFTDATTNTPTSWAWTFGDGGTSNLQNPSHTYANPGSYTVCLTATSACTTNTSCQTVVVSCSAPAAGFTFTTGSLNVSFSDTTGANPTAWAWTFGDGGTASIQSPSHVYASPGSYTVCVTATTPCGNATSCRTIVVSCPAPVGGFTSATTGLAVTFSDTTSGSPSAWAWTFGDGNTATSQSPSHTYSSPGTYTVCLTMTTACGSNTVCNTVTVTCAMPASSFTFNTNQAVVTFTDGSTGATSWSWNFDDGNTSANASPTHTYTVSGNYNVCLIVTNTCGSDTSCQMVNVIINDVTDELFGTLDIYPNPTKDMLKITGQLLETSELEITLISLLGKEMSTIHLGRINGVFNASIDLSNYASGVYFVKIVSDQGQVMRKVVRE